MDDLDISRVDARTQGGVTSGSRNVLMGTVAGYGSGNPITGALVAGAGYAKDKYGRAIGKNLLTKAAGSIKNLDT